MVSRRTLLRAFGVASAVSVSGCGSVFGGDEPDGGTETDEPTPSTPTVTPTATLSPKATDSPTDGPTPTATPTDSPTPTDTPTQTPTSTVTEQAGTPAFTAGPGPDANEFGVSVALSDDIALVDVEGEAVTVFEYGEDGWEGTTKLSPTDDDAEFYSYLPVPMTLDGDTAFLGGLSLGDEGAVDVVERVGDEWTRRARVTPDDDPEEPYYNFGRAVAHDAGTLVVGAVNTPTPMVSYRGHAFVFEGSGDDWTQVADFGTEPHDLFGRSVAVSGERFLVGAPGEGEGTDWNGKVHVYERSSGEWTRESTLTVDAEDTAFGRQVALDGDTAVVGAITSDESTAVYVFERENETWTERAQFSGLDGIDPVETATSIALDGDTALVGDLTATESGVVWRLQRTDDGWDRMARLVPDRPQAESQFGTAVALDGSSALVGAPTGDDDLLGRAYHFDL